MKEVNKEQILSNKSRNTQIISGIIYLYLVALTLLPALHVYALHGINAPFWLLAGDAYLYLDIARHSHLGFFTFDGEQPTNGFHPFWQYLLYLASGINNSRIFLANVSIITSLALETIGILMLARSIQRITQIAPLALLAAPGIYLFIAGQGLDGNLGTWDFQNGMESGLVIFLAGTLSLYVSRLRGGEPRNRQWFILGCILALIMFARLDEIFDIVAVGAVWLMWGRQPPKQAFSQVIILGIPSLVLLILYFSYNFLTVGVLMPVSGAAKGGLSILQNGWVTMVNIIPPTFDLRQAMTSYVGNYGSIMNAAFRVGELFIPGLYSIFAAILIRRRFRDSPWAPIMAGMCAGIFVKFLYNFVNVNYWNQASWYFAFASIWLSFVTAIFLAPFARQLRQIPGAACYLTTIYVFVSLLQMGAADAKVILTPAGPENRNLVMAGAKISRILEAKDPGAKVLEFGDGILNFSLDLPVRQGFQFAGDPKSLSALQHGHLLRESYDQGYRIIAGEDYLRWPGASTAASNSEIQQFLMNSTISSKVKSELSDYQLSIIYVYEPAEIPFILLKRRGVNGTQMN